MNVRQKWDVKYMLVCFMGTNDVCQAVCCWCVCVFLHVFACTASQILPDSQQFKTFLMVPIIVELLDDV